MTTPPQDKFWTLRWVGEYSVCFIRDTDILPIWVYDLNVLNIYQGGTETRFLYWQVKKPIYHLSYVKLPKIHFLYLYFCSPGPMSHDFHKKLIVFHKGIPLGGDKSIWILGGKNIIWSYWVFWALLNFWVCLDGGTTSKKPKHFGIYPKYCLFSFSVLTYRPQAFSGKWKYWKFWSFFAKISVLGPQRAKV